MKSKVDKNAFRNYIIENGFKTNNIDESNYRMLPGKGDPGWKLKIPKDKEIEFLTNYYIMKVEPNYPVGLLEVPNKKHNQLKIDIDLKYILSKEKENELGKNKYKHQYNLKTIIKLLKIYYKKMEKYIEIPNKGIKFTIFEKSKVREKFAVDMKSKYFKDGIHIVCPDVVLPNQILHAIRLDVIEDIKAQELIKDMNTNENISNVIDKSIIDKNGWLILGSGKPSDEIDNYYDTGSTYLFNKDKNAKIYVEEYELKLNKLEQIIYFSNYNKDFNVNLKNINLKDIENKLNLNNKIIDSFSEIDKFKLLNTARKNNNKKVDFNYIEKLLNCLKPYRYCEYESWFKVGICLYNISSNLFSLFDNWSAKWEHYNRDEVLKQWNVNIANYGGKYLLGLTQLRRFAKEDNPDMYYGFTNQKRFDFISDMINKINNQPTLTGKNSIKKFIGALDMAKYITEYIEFHCEWNIKCANNNSPYEWYRFEKGLWRQDSGANRLHKLFSNDLAPTLINIYDKFLNKVLELEKASISAGFKNKNYDDNNSETSSINLIDSTTENDMKKQIIRDKLATILQISEFLQKNTNRSNLIKDISQECYDEDFYKQLNENRNIFVCKNCVLDLEELVIREGLPEDMSTISAGVEFPHDIESEEAIECMTILSDFLDKIYPDYDVQNHILNVFAESLSGIIRREKFIIHTGSGANGKTVILDFMRIIFGEYFYAPDSTIYSFDNKDPNSVNPVIANCKGPRNIITGETKAGNPLNTNGIKKFTGGEPLTGRHLRQNTIEFKPQATFHMMCNDIPELDYCDGGIERRLEIIPYESKFVSKENYKLLKKKNHFIADSSFRDESKLRRLAPYFLRMLWDRYCDLKRNNFKDLLETNNIPEKVREVTNTYIKQSNTIDQFFEDRIEEKQGYKQELDLIYNEFKQYSVNNEVKPIQKNQFLNQFKRRISGNIKSEAKKKYVYDYVLVGNSGIEY